MNSYFITGTDTGVGKTTITAGLVSSIKKLGIDVGVMKPIATGIPQKNGFKSSDARLLQNASQVNDSEDLINPVFIPMPVSPYDACKILNLVFDKKIIIDKFKELQNKHKLLLVEGIGGIFTPLTKDYFVADMIKDLGLDTIIVTRSTLGTLNHTVMTVKVCQYYGIPIKGIIVNNFDENGGPEEKNAPSTISELTNIPLLGVIPFVKDYHSLDMIIPHIERNIDLKLLLS